jgi:hypothetical protein
MYDLYFKERMSGSECTTTLLCCIARDPRALVCVNNNKHAYAAKHVWPHTVGRVTILYARRKKISVQREVSVKIC